MTNFTTAVLAERRNEMIRVGAWNDNTLIDYFENALARSPHREAIISHRVADDSSTTLTYEELDQKATRIAAGLVALGVERGEVVSCQLPNWWQLTALHLACLRIGAVLNPLMPIFRARELRFMLAHAESRVLIIPKCFRDFDYEAMMDGLKAELPKLEHVLVIDGAGSNSFERVLLERSWEDETDTEQLFRERRPGGDDVIQLLYTSGTTGEPKGVLHSSNTLFANVREYAKRLGLNSDDRVLMSSPMAHQTGFLFGLMLPIYLSTTAVLQDIWNPAYAAQIIATTKPTYTMASTPFLADLVKVAQESEADLSSLRIFVSAGAPIPSALVERAAEVLSARIISAWGMTENGAVTMTRPEDPPLQASHSDGVALPFMEVKIADDEGRSLATGEDGRLLVRGASQFVGYLKRPDLSGLDAGGWFDTGDLARMDADGYIRITGRTKDVVIRGGENIPVVEVENLLYKHPAVEDAAIVGRPDERLGERIHAYLTLKKGYASLELAEVTSYLLEQGLSKSYLPEYLEVLDELPRTPSGKIQKFKLRERCSQSDPDISHAV